MKLLLTSTLAIAGAAAAAFEAAEYQSGSVHMRIKAQKEAQWERDRLAGKHDPTNWPSWKDWDAQGSWWREDRVRCNSDGYAIAQPGNKNQTFRCKNMDLYDFMNHASLGSEKAMGSSSWGWTSADGREFGAIGQGDGTAFVEISKKGKLTYLGRLPPQSVDSFWHEIRVYYDLVIIGSEAKHHGIQIFDMKKLLTIDPASPVTFNPETDLVGHFTQLPSGSTHNVAINWDFGYAVGVGALPRESPCAGGMIYIDLSDPTNPTSPGCAGQDGYVHDAQCVRYNGPDSRYSGRDICMGYNEDTLTIYDSTEKTGKNSSRVISKTTYPGATYTHQGWFINENWHDFLLLDDEYDEYEANGPAADGYPKTHILDVSDLENPQYSGYFNATDGVRSIDHNQYVVNGIAYQSNYGAGVWVHDVSSIPSDPTGGGVETLGFFDIAPEDDDSRGGGIIEFIGTWSHFLLPSGFVVVNSIERGAFVVKIAQGKGAGPGPGYRTK